MGTYEFVYGLVEPRVRRLVADSLGVDCGALAAEISLTDDLAADSLDLVELALTLEAEFGIEVPERTLDEVRTYGDLVHATLTLSRKRLEAEARKGETPAFVWTRVLPRVGQPGGSIERGGWLTPYTAETIAEDVLQAGRGARLEVTMGADTDDADLTRVQHQFARLGRRGVQVNVRRSEQPSHIAADETVAAAQPEQLPLPLRTVAAIVSTPATEMMIGSGGGRGYGPRAVDQRLRQRAQRTGPG